MNCSERVLSLTLNLLHDMRYLPILFIASLLMACNSETYESEAISTAVKAYDAQQNQDNGRALVNAYLQYINQNKDFADKNTTAAALQKAIVVADEQKLSRERTALMHIAIRDYYDEADTPQNIYDMAEGFKEQGNVFASQAVFLGLAEAFPDHELTKKASAKTSMEFQSLDQMIRGLAERMFNQEASVIDKDIAAAYVNVCEAHALTKPKDEQSPLYLHRAAEIARSLGHVNKTMNIYDWLLVKYPQDSLAGQALFLKAQTLDDLMDREEDAKPLYEEFIKKYPNSPFADDAEFQLQMLGKSDEEVLEEILRRAKEREAAGEQ